MTCLFQTMVTQKKFWRLLSLHYMPFAINILMHTFMHQAARKHGQDFTEWVLPNITTKCRQIFIYMDKSEIISLNLNLV